MNLITIQIHNEFSHINKMQKDDIAYIQYELDSDLESETSEGIKITVEIKCLGNNIFKISHVNADCKPISIEYSVNVYGGDITTVIKNINANMYMKYPNGINLEISLIIIFDALIRIGKVLNWSEIIYEIENYDVAFNLNKNENMLGRVLTKYGFVFKCLDVDEAILVKDMKKESENNECEKLLKRLIYRNQSIIKERH